MKFQNQRGTADVLPAESERWLNLESKFREVASLFGYQEIRTPTFEDTELFTRSSGETSDIVSKQMYSFEDKGGRNVTLKPEVTASALRAVIQNNLCPPGTQLRLSYVSPIFRYERPQKGRLREAHQFGLELLGVSSERGDAEIIEATIQFYRAIGLKDLIVTLNSLGREETRKNYRAALLKFADGYLSGQDEETRAKIEKNPLRMLDSKDPELIELMKSAPSILDFLEEESKTRFASLQRILSRAGVDFEVRSETVRGLDYYTETVFEVQSTLLGAQGALCGGGRYDGLIHELGGSQTPAVGVGMGIERALLVQEAAGIVPIKPGLQVFVVSVTPEMGAEAADIAASLRAAGLRTLVDLDLKSVKSQLRMADKEEAKFAVFVGPDELAQGAVLLKNLGSGEQASVMVSSIISVIKDQLCGS